MYIFISCFTLRPALEHCIGGPLQHCSCCAAQAPAWGQAALLGLSFPPPTRKAARTKAQLSARLQDHHPVDDAHSAAHFFDDLAESNEAPHAQIDETHALGGCRAAAV